MTEQDALALKYLYEITKSGSDASEKSDTVNGISLATRIDSSAVRITLGKLEVTCFVDKKRIGRFMRYAITDDGAYALNYLMSSKRYPGRKEKFDSLLVAATKGGSDDKC